jgi:hypothetical protein
MVIIDGAEPVDWGGLKFAEKFSAVQVVMQRKSAHQRPVDEQINAHTLHRLTEFRASAGLGRSLPELLTMKTGMQS